MQITKTVEDQKVKIVSQRRSYCGNPCGFYVFINDMKFFVNKLTHKEAQEAALVMYFGKVV